MKVEDLFFGQNNIQCYIDMERYVNDGSPSGSHLLHTTSEWTNPFTGKEKFSLLEFSDSDVDTRYIGKKHPLFRYGVNYAHPDSMQSVHLLEAKRKIENSFLLVSPTAGARTMLLRNSENLGYLKLTYDVSRIGRVDRQLTYKHCLSSYEASSTLKQKIDEGNLPPQLCIQLESSAKVSLLQGLHSNFEWGTIFREFKPYPYSPKKVQLVPGFSLFSKDIRNPSDDCLLVQFIQAAGENPKKYLMNLLKMIVDCYWAIVLNCAFHIECHAQNCLFEVDENYKIVRMVIKDMDSVDKDIPLAKYLGHNTSWESYPVMCFDENIHFYKIRPSYMYDFKLGEYLLHPLIYAVTKKYELNPEYFEQEIQQYVNAKYIGKLPDDYFPKDGCWYNCDNSERIPGTKRIYYANPKPKFRHGGIYMNQKQFDTVVEAMSSSLDKKGNHLDMTSLIVSSNGDYFKHYFKDREPIDIRSIAKPILCLAAGAAIDEGLYFNSKKINLESYIWEFVSKYTKIQSVEQQKKWEQVKLIDLFKITLGHERGIVFSADVREQNEDDLANYIVNFPITKEVGQHFVYSNAGTFLFSTLLTEYCGLNADEFVDKYIFSKLGIKEFSWKKYGKYCAGCTGLKIYNEDLHKIGELILSNGMYNGRQIVPAKWVELMRTPLVASPTHRYVIGRAFPKWSYGLNLWICEDGNYYCDGTDGQYMIIIPKKKMVVTAMGHQSDTQPVSECLGLLK